MLAYLGPANGLDVNHKNSDKADNRLENLEYVSRKENIHHAIRAGTNKIKGEANKLSKLSEDQVKKILFEDGRKFCEIAKDYGVTSAAIALIKCGKNWAHLTDGKKYLVLKSPAGDAFKSGEKHLLSKLTANDVKSMRLSFADGTMTAIEIANKFKIERSYVYKVLRKTTWKYV